MADTETVPLRIAEYEALRNESLRCANVLSSSVWIAVSGFVVTVGGAAAVFAALVEGSDVATAMATWQRLNATEVVAALLLLQSLAAISMYLGELWKFIRIGDYIRHRFETPLARRDSKWPSMYWEHSILRSGRAYGLHLVALLLLLSPSGVVVLSYGLPDAGLWWEFGWKGAGISTSELIKVFGLVVGVIAVLHTVWIIRARSKFKQLIENVSVISTHDVV